MNENRVNVRQLVDKYQANCDRIGEIADLCETEQRERTAGETAEFESLTRENQLIQMRLGSRCGSSQGESRCPQGRHETDPRERGQ